MGPHADAILQAALEVATREAFGHEKSLKLAGYGLVLFAKLISVRCMAERDMGVGEHGHNP
jgi:hypothetical protein